MKKKLPYRIDLRGNITLAWGFLEEIGYTLMP